MATKSAKPIKSLFTVSVFFLFMVFACAGCGSKNSSVARVQGTVLLDSKPLPSGAISTIPIAGRGAKGIIKNGEFELSTYGSNDGAVPGTHKVAVVAYEKTSGGAEGGPGKPLIPDRYMNPNTSELTIEVKAGDVNTPTLNLTSQ